MWLTPPFHLPCRGRRQTGRAGSIRNRHWRRENKNGVSTAAAWRLRRDRDCRRLKLKVALGALHGTILDRVAVRCLAPFYEEKPQAIAAMVLAVALTMGRSKYALFKRPSWRHTNKLSNNRIGAKTKDYSYHAKFRRSSKGNCVPKSVAFVKSDILYAGLRVTESDDSISDYRLARPPGIVQLGAKKKEKKKQGICKIK